MSLSIARSKFWAITSNDISTNLTHERTNLIDVGLERSTGALFDLGPTSGVTMFFRFAIGDALGGDKTIFGWHGVNDRRCRAFGIAIIGDRKLLLDGVLPEICVRLSTNIGLNGINGEFGACTRLYMLLFNSFLFQY